MNPEKATPTSCASRQVYHDPYSCRVMRAGNTCAAAGAAFHQELLSSDTGVQPCGCQHLLDPHCIAQWLCWKTHDLLFSSLWQQALGSSTIMQVGSKAMAYVMLHEEAMLDLLEIPQHHEHTMKRFNLSIYRWASRRWRM